MTLIEELRGLWIDNLDTDDVLFDYENDQEGFEFFLHNLQAMLEANDLAEAWEKMNSLEVNEDVLVDLRDNEGENYFGEDARITQTIFEAAWLTRRGIDYEDLEDNIQDDVYNYGFTFGDFFFEYEAGIDIL